MLEFNYYNTEKVWFNFVKKNYSDLFSNIGDITRFNRTKRNLYKVILEIQKYLSNLPIYMDCFFAGKGVNIKIISKQIKKFNELFSSIKPKQVCSPPLCFIILCGNIYYFIVEENIKV
ncbi:hypothetical protein Ccar_10925 [Clostridium carboxidivorans P7]|uniref:Uncharacterized protein n=1 Tax=Clostridium carboxidivorans P7 TaxID=536227 RepID=C6PYY8_9CLOT|nr:hypothetical protein Ccar_10925 [Clostridium carboxidivorans P7]EET85522.1 hypothetical protein CcarbDRAFT_4005 [Clostridium carboxidivorans P7]